MVIDISRKSHKMFPTLKNNAAAGRRRLGSSRNALPSGWGRERVAWRAQTTAVKETTGQSRTQSPQAFWSAGRRQERLWRIWKNFKFFDWLLCFSCVTASIVLPQKSCGNKIPVPQSLSWRLTAGQRAWGLWVWDWLQAIMVQWK